MPNWTYRCEFVCCGRCKTRCAHGPYWYGYRHEGGKMKKRYFGRTDPREPLPATPGPSPATAERDWWTPMTHKKSASIGLAMRILGVSEVISREQVYRAYRVQQLEHHPDRGGLQSRAQAINAAWSYAKAWFRW